jgi:hypothetical protein
MSHIPNNFIRGRIKDIMESHGHLYDTQIRRKVPSIFRDNLDDQRPDLFGKLRKLLHGAILQVLGAFNTIKKCVH